MPIYKYRHVLTNDPSLDRLQVCLSPNHACWVPRRCNMHWSGQYSVSQVARHANIIQKLMFFIWSLQVFFKTCNKLFITGQTASMSKYQLCLLGSQQMYAKVLTLPAGFLPGVCISTICMTYGKLLCIYNRTSGPCENKASWCFPCEDVGS